MRNQKWGCVSREARADLSFHSVLTPFVDFIMSWLINGFTRCLENSVDLDKNQLISIFTGVNFKRTRVQVYSKTIGPQFYFKLSQRERILSFKSSP